MRVFWSCVATHPDPHGLLRELNMYTSPAVANTIVNSARTTHLLQDVFSDDLLVDTFRVGYELEGAVSDEVFNAEMVLMGINLGAADCAESGYVGPFPTPVPPTETTSVSYWWTWEELLGLYEADEDPGLTRTMLQDTNEVDLLLVHCAPDYGYGVAYLKYYDPSSPPRDVPSEHITYVFDDHEPIRALWAKGTRSSTEYQSYFVPDDLQDTFLRDLMSVSRLHVTMNEYSDVATSTLFLVSGFEDAFAPVKAECERLGY